MPWGMFFTIIAQTLIVVLVLAILTAIVLVIYRDVKKDFPDNKQDPDQWKDEV
jgi:heme/copper-type cytochrome/quinol oxidase subunit 2